VTTGLTTAEQVRAVLADVTDPEIPVITIEDLGILRDVAVDGGHVTVTITPTYSGCPAMDEIRADIRTALAAHGVDDVEVRMTLSPAWTTDWMSEAGRDKLRAYGIAPPQRRAAGPVLVQLGAPRTAPPACPQCGSGDTEELTRFASTACKSMWRCRSCREPFDHFKAH
jgi:ring-1,2-phenylacetyl-CoA epoxidase subunit PaaD